jgi:hypothetical protein
LIVCFIKSIWYYVNSHSKNSVPYLHGIKYVNYGKHIQMYSLKYLLWAVHFMNLKKKKRSWVREWKWNNYWILHIQIELSGLKIKWKLKFTLKSKSSTYYIQSINTINISGLLYPAWLVDTLFVHWFPVWLRRMFKSSNTLAHWKYRKYDHLLYKTHIIMQQTFAINSRTWSLAVNKGKWIFVIQNNNHIKQIFVVSLPIDNLWFVFCYVIEHNFPDWIKSDQEHYESVLINQFKIFALGITFLHICTLFGPSSAIVWILHPI